MKYINRWGLMRNSLPENIQEHSLQVAIIAHALAVIKNTYFDGKVDVNKAAVMGIFHDSNEIITGDLPTPIKYYNPEINIAYKQIENISKERLIGMLPEEMKETYRNIYFSENADSEIGHIVKAADKISAFIKCVEEEKAGNTEFKKAREALHDYLIKNKSLEVEYFMKEFIPSFYLTLDEID
jgi:5'-deoxynucleotidase